MVRGTFSPARAWRPTVVARLARTLGCTKPMTAPLLTVRGLRGSGTVLTCQLSAAQERGGWTLRANSGNQPGHARLPRRQRRRIEAPACFRKVNRRDVRAQHRALWPQASTPGNGFHSGCVIARRKAPCRTHGVARRRGVPRLLSPQRGAAANVPRQQRHAFHRGARVQPNPSFKPSPNGGPPGPGNRYGVHFLSPGPGVPPSVPA